MRSLVRSIKSVRYDHMITDFFFFFLLAIEEENFDNMWFQ